MAIDHSCAPANAKLNVLRHREQFEEEPRQNRDHGSDNRAAKQAWRRYIS